MDLRHNAGTNAGNEAAVPVVRPGAHHWTFFLHLLTFDVKALFSFASQGHRRQQKSKFSTTQNCLYIFAL